MTRHSLGLLADIVQDGQLVTNPWIFRRVLGFWGFGAGFRVEGLFGE